MKDVKLWRSFLRAPVKITVTLENGDIIEKPLEEYLDAEFDIVDRDEKALATITMALSPDIAQGFREYTIVKSLWEALIEVYEGNDDMKQSRQDMLRQKFNMFNHMIGETLEIQLQRFITLNNEMATARIVLSKAEVNKKLLNSLPKSWDMNVAVIKKTRDLGKLSLSEVMAIIKACDIDDKKTEINHVSSYQTANLGISTNSAFSAIYAKVPTQQASSSSSTPLASSVPPVPTSAASSPVLPKGAKENLGMMACLLNCYNALVAGELVQPMMVVDLNQVNPDDLEEMDISWHIAMAVFRAKRFT
ncbi:hypothetical protein L2E82_30785 [Cichorium intybus]|uniref:Uncharacterized protein n=1 Tax=Cichorium intybus TaxID=13427 RepID=A0ACB9D1B5_CICIN|nr:hypothetical protein L2E82_30785 [Cichorium intybus]